MATVHEIRASVDSKLDAWEKQALALEAQLTHTKEQAIERVETQKQHFSEAVEKFNVEIKTEGKDLPEELLLKIKNQIEHLQVQLALGKVDTREAYESQKKKITEALNALEASLDEAGETAALEAIKHTLVEKANAIEAELAGLEAQFKTRQAQFETQQQELTVKIQAYKDDIEAKKQMAQEKAAVFERELSEGLVQIQQAFSKLFS